ncbi:hypothetical protein AXF15_10030 [Desulfomicrobium orale DSM 12838]|uniref:Uncharacterized protein n=1 Tax=Desulfomicrobium orale DSM 12838 TaxID=888061 RepID=A0A0X8JR64_9BACT|nr:hypothetical protein AXF15_10030 [Desulfomicrobium orale DSM 12838]
MTVFSPSICNFLIFHHTFWPVLTLSEIFFWRTALGKPHKKRRTTLKSVSALGKPHKKADHPEKSASAKRFIMKIM